ncbi:hypothetical protein NDA12_003818 [Ustilago hordei]|nr:hypothetical protein NDA15_003324 [Ustilago hordei]KAJ1571804.1 hypothetical protein NDA12_003818 [Ustilago hordei]
MTSRKLFSRLRKAAPRSSEHAHPPYTNGHAHSGSHFSDTTHDERVLRRTDTNHSTSALSSVSTSSRTSKFFRRFARSKPPPVPSLPPALVLDLDAGHALPRTSSTTTRTGGQGGQPTAAAAVIAQSNAAYASAKPAPLQRREMLQALTNAHLDVAQMRDLVRMCGLQIRERGLDTPGLFRPFRIAESGESVQHMLQLFLLSLDTSTYIAVFPILPENALDRLERSSTRPQSAQDKAKIACEELDKELRYASPHDIVSVLKWGLRHMRLQCSDFNCKSSDEWYDCFCSLERESRYQPRAIADFLHPKLPQATAELLSETLDLVASVAAHSSSNHMSASALCKSLGFWLLGRIGVAHPPPTFDELKETVDKASAMVEHLLLAHIRSQAAVTYAMPLRLTELVQKYPHIKQGSSTPGLPPAFASRPVPTLRIDLKSENILVSQAKPRVPSSTLADALEAQAADGIEGEEGELWGQTMLAMDSDIGEGTGRGYELLIDEHVRILRKVDEAIALNTEKHSGLSDAATAAATLAETKANRRRSQSLSDLRNPYLPTPANRPLFPLPESGTSSPAKGSTPKRKAVPFANLSSEALEETPDHPPPPLPSNQDFFNGGLQPSQSWRSFSETGFGIMSTASSDLSLTQLHLRPTHPSLPTRRSPRGALHRVRSTTSNGYRRKTAFPLPPAHTGIEGVGVKKINTVTKATMVEMDTSFAILWQDQLLDSSPCASFPSLVFVQLNSHTATCLRQKEREHIWLLIVENVVPPRPPTPPSSGGGKAGKGGKGGWDADSQWAERRSVFGAQSIKSVRMRLRRVSTVIGNGVSGRNRKQQQLETVEGEIATAT